MSFLSPEEINAKHGKLSWTCWSCKGEKNLHWWHGVSIACCSQPKCAQAIGEFMAASQKELDDAEAAYWREYGG